MGTLVQINQDFSFPCNNANLSTENGTLKLVLWSLVDYLNFLPFSRHGSATTK